MNILGIETSCDETAAAVVKDGTELLSNEIVSQIDIHAAFGGVVPEVAARSHLEVITPVIDKALKTAFPGSLPGKLWDRVDAIGVTKGPGLAGSLLIGTLAARTLAIIKNKPLYGLHHVEGHVYANFLVQPIPRFPLLALIVSGGHSQLVVFRNHFDYHLLGQTRDDAVGEAFDKVAKVLGLPYPGGPSISKAAGQGDPEAYSFPVARLTNTYDFSFSGLKTAVLRQAQAAIGESYSFPSHQIAARLTVKQQGNLAASFQAVAVKTLVQATARAVQAHLPASVVIAGGVAANALLRQELTTALPNYSITYADANLCTDNAAMIASLAYFKAQAMKPDNPHNLEIMPSWPM